MERRNTALILRDTTIVIFSILFALLLVEAGVLNHFLATFHSSFLLTAFVSGVLFTTVFTTAIAAAAFVVLGSDNYNPFLIAFLGSLGAMCGDLLLYRFIRDDITKDILFLCKRFDRGLLYHLFRSRLFRVFLPIIAGFIIMSPLPDELGIALFGFAKINLRYLSLLAFVFNFLGILGIVYLGELF